MAFKKILIIGRPNVGKSTLINRLLKSKAAITLDQPGVTRDLNEFLVTHKSCSFLVVDSGGIFAEKNDSFEFQSDVESLVQTAIFDMSKILFVVDSQQGLLPADVNIAKLLRDNVPEKTVFVANKADNDALANNLAEFCKLGLGEPLPISSLQGRGLDRLLDRLVVGFSSSDMQLDSLEKRFKVSFVGRPNVGKSSLLNAIINSDHSIVNSKSGTTRDSIHVFFKQNGMVFELIDTAGLRKVSKMKDNIEFYSSVRTNRSIQEADLVVMLIDGERGFCNQDKKIIQTIFDAGKSMMLFVNKSDMLETDQVKKDFQLILETQMHPLKNYPIHFGSALTKQGLKTLLTDIPSMFVSVKERIQTKVLNDFNQDVIRRFPPPAKYGKQLKIYYLTQVELLPPTFVCFVNHKKYLTEDYRRFLEKRIRDYLGGFFGHTIRLFFKGHRQADQ
jgi:GTP-binding protein